MADGTQAVPARAKPTVKQSRASLPQEHVVARLRQSGRRLVVPTVLFLALCFGTGYWWGRLSPAWLDTALPAVAGALALLLCVAPLLRWRNRVVLVTDRRLIVLRGFVIRRRTEFLLAPGAEATLKRGPLQLLAGSGDVIVRAGAEGTMVLHDVPSARLVHAAILEVAGRLR